MSTGMRKWMEKDCPDIPSLPAEVSIDREELRQLHDELAQYKNERDKLRARIEAMERQEPVAWQWELKAGQYTYVDKPEHAGKNARLVPLYALPGAKGE